MVDRTSKVAKKTVTARPKRESARTMQARPLEEVVREAVDEVIETAVVIVAPVAASDSQPVSKQKLVRDSFTMPKNEYEALDVLKKRLLQSSRSVKKGELIRAGVRALTLMPDDELVAAVSHIPNLKTGRPKNGKAPVDKPRSKALS